MTGIGLHYTWRLKKDISRSYSRCSNARPIREFKIVINVSRINGDYKGGGTVTI
jgi:hypothetical protein